MVYILSGEKPKYRVLKEYLLERIKTENLKPGDQMQSENELADKFGISRHTVRQAVGEMVSEGWLYRVQGKGTFIDRRPDIVNPSSKVIGVITTYMDDYIFPSIIRGIEGELSREGYNITLGCTRNCHEKEKACLDKMLGLNIDGLIVESTMSALPNPNIFLYKELSAKGIPIIFIHGYYKGLNYSYIVEDDYCGGYLAAKHLIKLGHRRISGVFKNDDIQGQLRFEGFMKACSESGISISDSRLIWFNTYDFENKLTVSIGDKLRNMIRESFAVVCYNDQIAKELIDIINDMGLSVPEDISIVSFDDSHIASASTPKLTTLAHPKERLGIKAAGSILQMIKREANYFSIKIQPELIVRDSTKSILKMEECKMGKKYSIGVDYGTQSGRSVLVEVDSGREVAVSVKEYPHGVMDEYLPDGRTRLEHDWALQHPQDYLDVLSETIPAVLNKAGVSADDVIGIGIDFTACTILPIDEKGKPLCFFEEFKSEPHAYVKLWKHHAAQDKANMLNDIANKRGEEFLKLYGGKISSEWFIPKVWQVLDEAPHIYGRADRFIEAADWIVLNLTGEEKRNSCTAGYKAMWHKQKGYPSKDFFKALDPRLENVVDEKMSNDIYSIGSKAGELTEEAAAMTGLKAGIAVAVGNIDAHVAMPAVGITEAGKMLMIMGTSTCHLILGDEEKLVPGICGVVEDGIIPGYFGYEAGQSCVGDHFEWFVKNCVPAEYTKEAQERGISIHKVLREKAQNLKAGESGLVALDWWNGNRSVLVDVDLTGLIIGCTLTTKPEEIYRALIEATAYGTRMIIETFEENGVLIKDLVAAGGIAEKDELMMQIYSDVTNREIRISASAQTPALGSAMFGAVAAGKERGGYDNIAEASKYMSKVKDKVYKPDKENVKVYNKLYAEYKLLHDYFGRGENNVMKRLKEIKKESRE